MAFVDPVRHCQTCVSLSKTEEEFFTEHIKVLVSGAPFHVTTSSTTSTPTTPESPAVTEELSLASGSIFHEPTSVGQLTGLISAADDMLKVTLPCTLSFLSGP